jgi:hypothetical protein
LSTVDFEIGANPQSSSIRNAQSAIRNQIGNRQSAIGNIFHSAIRNWQWTGRNPQSAIRNRQ